MKSYNVAEMPMNNKPLKELLDTYGTSRGNKQGPRAYLRRVLEGEGSLPSVPRTAALLGGAGFKGSSNSLSISTRAAEDIRRHVLFTQPNERKKSND